jgi:hypothetical protein
VNALDLPPLPRLHERLDHRPLRGLAVDVGAALLHAPPHLPQLPLQLLNLRGSCRLVLARLLCLPPAGTRLATERGRQRVSGVLGLVVA